MDIKLNHIKVSELVKGYENSDENGVFGYDKNLNIRPPYQREFVYKEEQQKAVIDTVLKGYPLNVMYWVKHNDGKFEVMDGQQRTLSICEYVANHYSVEVDGYAKPFHSLPKDVQDKILNYELMVYFCEGAESEKLEWFKTVNIAGEKLTNQEILNAVYAGSWTADAKKKFSKTNCVAYKIGSKYMSGTPIRQDYLETALKWISKGKIEKYMSDHQHEPNANALWAYYQSIINWVKNTFTEYRNEMKGVDWGKLYDQYHENVYDTVKLEEEIKALMADDDVSNKKGIYSYVLTKNEKYLNIREFTQTMKRSAYTRQNGVCIKCKKKFKFEEMHGDHITPWSKGGKTNAENCQMLCADCNRRKSDV